jgi:Ser/Thr protein kinase RdoA (MazF antagonist)
MRNFLHQIRETWGFKKIKLIEVLRSSQSKLVYLISTDLGKYIVTGFGLGRNENSFTKYILMLEYLESKPYKLSPKILKTKEDQSFAKIDNTFLCITEFIEGRILKQTTEDGYLLGQATALLNSLDDCELFSPIQIEDIIKAAYEKLSNCPLKTEYYRMIESLPNFNNYKQGFIHTDIAPHNAILSNNNQVVFIDFDFAGKGSVYIDAGFPLITQFVRFTGPDELRFNYENAAAFYKGYSSVTKLNHRDKELMYQGAIFRQLMHMAHYEPGGQNLTFQILKFAVDHKDLLISVL